MHSWDIGHFNGNGSSARNHIGHLRTRSTCSKPVPVKHSGARGDRHIEKYQYSNSLHDEQFEGTNGRTARDVIAPWPEPCAGTIGDIMVNICSWAYLIRNFEIADQYRICETVPLRSSLSKFRLITQTSRRVRPSFG